MAGSVRVLLIVLLSNFHRVIVVVCAAVDVLVVVVGGVRSIDFVVNPIHVQCLPVIYTALVANTRH